MTESPFAPSRCYLLGSRVVHGLDQRYPVFIAHTGSCVIPRFSVSLCHPALLHSLCISSDAWTPTTVADRVLSPVSSPVTSAFPKFPMGRLNHKVPLNDFRAGGITRLQSFDDLQASEFAATQVVPTAGNQLGCQGGRGVYVRAERGSLPPRR